MEDISKIVRDTYHATGTTVAHALLKKYIIIDSPKIDYKTDEHYDITTEGVTYNGHLINPYDRYDTVSRLCEAADAFRGMTAVEEAYKEFDAVSSKLKELAAKLYLTANSGLVSAVITVTEEGFTFDGIPHHERSQYLEMAKSAMDFVKDSTPKPAPSTPEFKKTAPTSPWQG